MAVKSWNAGDVLTAADMDAWAVPLAGYKTADLSRASTTTPTPDPDMTINLAANAVYEVRTVLMFTCTAAGVDLRFLFTVPSGATGQYIHWYWSGSTTFAGPAIIADPFTQTRSANIEAAGTSGITGHGTIFTSATADALTVQWSQNVSSATAVIMRKGSLLTANRVG